MKLPRGAFEHYVALGPERSYQAVALHFGCSKVAVTKRAMKEAWQERLRTMEEEAARASEKKALESLEAVRARQLKMARLLQSRAIEALKDLPAERAVKAAAALSIGWKHELLLLGEPTERQANVEEIVRREYQRWMVVEDGDGEVAATGQARALP